MAKAMLFDWFNTLAQYYPPRERLHADACRDMGIEVAEDRIPRGLLLADHFYTTENARLPLKQRPLQEQIDVFTRMERIVLQEAGATGVSDELALGIIQNVGKVFSDTTFALFDDVLAAFVRLKRRRLILGVVSNLNRDLMPVCQELGLAPYLDLSVTSREVGSEKPHPAIFLAALERAGVGATEAVYVGDHYGTDVLGARGVGMQAVLLDRHGLFHHIDCPRVNTLSDLLHHV